MSIWQCPQGKAFIEKICDELFKGTHYVVCFPKPHITRFLSAFQTYAKQMLGGTKTVIWNGEQTLTDSLSSLFNCNIKNWLELPSYNLPNGISLLVLVISDSLPHECEQDFLHFLIHMKSHAHTLRDKGKTNAKWNLLVISNPDVCIPKDDMDMRVLRWWGMLRPSDLEYAIEQNTYPVLDSLDDAMLCWFKALCRGFAVCDPELVETLFNHLPHNSKELRKAFDQHPFYTKEISVLASQYTDIRELMVGRKIPSAKGIILWSLGIFDLDCHGVPSIHPVALAAANRTEELERMAVNGQIKVYLPMVQQVLDFIRRYMSYTFGSDWDKKSTTYEGMEYDIGKLPKYLSTFFYHNIPKDIYSLASLWRKVRHLLAHGHMVDQETAEKAVRLLCTLQDSGKYN